MDIQQTKNEVTRLLREHRLATDRAVELRAELASTEQAAASILRHAQDLQEQLKAMEPA